ncbi:MAG: dihydroorotase [bacterium]
MAKNNVILIKDARLLDPATGKDETGSVLVRDGVIEKIGNGISAKNAAEVDGNGLWLFPGLVDMHTHLRQPGQETKETFLTGTRAAAAGGVTRVVTMANTIPVLDNKTGVEFVVETARSDGRVHVHPVGSVTKGLEGKEISDIGEIVHAGAVALSDDGHGVMNAQVLRRAMEYTTIFDIPIISHCEDHNLSAGGVMNDGRVSTFMGLPGIPSEAETVMVSRDILLAKKTGARLHIAHVSCAESVELIRTYKKRGVRVTAETAIHYLLLTENAVEGYNTNAKMNPPLRTEEDRQALLEGLRDGTIDAIASDHAPHTRGDKAQEFDQASFGIVGLETTVPLMLTYLPKENLDLLRLLACMTTAPCEILKIPAGKLEIGAIADLTVWNPEGDSVIDSSRFYSKGRNTPFNGWKVTGRVEGTMVAGRFVFAPPEGRIAPLLSAESR